MVCLHRGSDSSIRRMQHLVLEVTFKDARIKTALLTLQWHHCITFTTGGINEDEEDFRVYRFDHFFLFPLNKIHYAEIGPKTTHKTANHKKNRPKRRETSQLVGENGGEDETNHCTCRRANYI